MEKRAILAIVLSLLVVVLWSILFAPSSPPPTDIPPEQQAQDVSQIPPPAPRDFVQEVPPSDSTKGALQESSGPPATAVTVDTGVARLTLTGKGAGISSVQLHHFYTTLDREAPPVEITPVPGATTMPLAAELQQDQRSIALSTVMFTPSTTEIVLSEHQPVGTVVFRGHIADGMAVQRVYRFRHGSYVFEVDTQIEGLPSAAKGYMTLFWGPGLLRQTEGVKRRGQTGTVPRSYIGGKIFQETPKKVGDAQVQPGEVTWTALADTYFTAVLIPQEPAADAMIVRRVQEKALEVGLRTPFEGSRAKQNVQVYVGPKKQQILEETGASLDKLIDLGFFSPLARPMMHLLRFINGVVHNYGVTIILVTILIKATFWPLTQKSSKSMAAMQKLQPKMKELQVIYKDDKQALNRATMQLYRDNKVNPMGGCLPMLLQIPFFFAFYNALLYSIELRHAPFICWEREIFWVGRGICDLSVHDPSYITPILMGISMFAQQRMTPTTGDPTQAKMMQFMPLMFLFFFLKAPAGLVIYWFVNNLLSMAQQLLVNRTRQLEAAKAETAGAE